MFNDSAHRNVVTGIYIAIKKTKWIRKLYYKLILEIDVGAFVLNTVYMRFVHVIVVFSTDSMVLRDYRKIFGSRSHRVGKIINTTDTLHTRR